jgi:hypothetical protein
MTGLTLDFGIDRDRFMATGGGGHQGQTTPARTGEADRADHRMGDQADADFIARAIDEREHAFGQARGGNSGLDRLARQQRGAGVGLMGLDDHRAAGGQRRRRVATRNREGEREVGGAEHGDGADGKPARAQVGARHRLAFRQGGFDDHIGAGRRRTS